MRLLLDNNLSARLVAELTSAGHDVQHVRDLGMSAAKDPEVMARAADDDRVLVTGDSDFGTLLAMTGAAKPSVIFLRRTNGRRFTEIAGVLLANLPEIEDDLIAGAIVVIAQEEMRIRRLPIR